MASISLDRRLLRSLTFQTLGVLDEIGVGVVHLEVKFDGLQQNPLHRHDFLLADAEKRDRQTTSTLGTEARRF